MHVCTRQISANLKLSNEFNASELEVTSWVITLRTEEEAVEAARAVDTIDLIVFLLSIIYCHTEEFEVWLRVRSVGCCWSCWLSTAFRLDLSLPSLVEDVNVCRRQGSEVVQVVVPVELLEGSKLMPECASLAIGAHLVFVELRTILRLVQVLCLRLLFCHLVVCFEFFDAVSVVAMPPELTVAWCLLPVLAKLSLHTLTPAICGLARTVLLDEGLCASCGHKV